MMALLNPKLCPICRLRILDCVEKGTCDMAFENAMMGAERTEVQVLKLVPRANTPNADLVSMLERMLIEAKTGELDAVAIGCSWADGCTSYGWSTAPSVNRMVAGIARLQHAYMTEAAS